jgi:hypothetical protein
MRVAALVTLLLALVVAPGAVAATIVEELPITQTFTNPCNGEVFTVNGTVRHVLTTNVSESGSILVVEHFNFQGVEGASASGARYVVPSSNTLIAHAKEGSVASSFRFEATQRFVLAGGATADDDLLMRVVSVFVVDASGQVIRRQFDVKLVCN